MSRILFLSLCFVLMSLKGGVASEDIRTCDNTPFKQKLARVGLDHLLAKNGSVQRAGIFVEPAELLGGTTGTWIIFFSSSFRCGELGLDGGGWVVVIDPKSLKVISSRYSGF